MRKWMHVLMLSCKKATEWMEKKDFAPLSGIESIQLFVHTHMCDACGRYARQRELIDRMLRRDSVPEDRIRNVPSEVLPPETRAAIIRKLDK